MTVDRHAALEEAVFRALNSDGGRLLDAAAVVLSTRWFGAIAAAAVVVAIVLACRSRRLGLLIAFALALAMSDFVGAQVVRPLVGRMRPCFALAARDVRWLAPASDVGSLPSLHAANFFAMAVVAWIADRRIGLAALPVAAAVALSRVYVGVHWPTDVVAGAAWGAACGLAGATLARRLVAAREAPRDAA
jgi:undecaprenyl-diphosphatase